MKIIIEVSDEKAAYKEVKECNLAAVPSVLSEWAEKIKQVMVE